MSRRRASRRRGPGASGRGCLRPRREARPFRPSPPSRSGLSRRFPRRPCRRERRPATRRPPRPFLPPAFRPSRALSPSGRLARADPPETFHRRPRRHVRRRPPSRSAPAPRRGRGPSRPARRRRADPVPRPSRRRRAPRNRTAAPKTTAPAASSGHARGVKTGPSVSRPSEVSVVPSRSPARKSRAEAVVESRVEAAPTGWAGVKPSASARPAATDRRGSWLIGFLAGAASRRRRRFGRSPRRGGRK